MTNGSDHSTPSTDHKKLLSYRLWQLFSEKRHNEIDEGVRDLEDGLRDAIEWIGDWHHVTSRRLDSRRELLAKLRKVLK